VGYGIISSALPVTNRTQVIVLAPAVGILVLSALTAFWVRLGLPLIWVSALWFALVVVGALFLWSDRALWTKNTISYGLTLAVFSALICAVYFLPSARNDIVERADGSFNWKFMDTQHFHAIASSIKNGGSPPKTPGTVTADLLYHFGPYAPAAAISRFDGLKLGDAVARVTHGASLWALSLSCFGFGTLLSLKATGKKFGGIMSVAGLFFYGSLLSLFTDETSSSGNTAGAIAFKIPGAEVPALGGPFDHFLVGHSVLHGLVAITAILALFLVERERGMSLPWRIVVLLALPALAVPVHSVAAMYCLGVGAILLFWGRLRDAKSWLPITLMLCLFLGAWKIMGYGHAPDAAGAMIKEHLAGQWWTVAVWLVVGLGFRIVSFRWIARPLNDSVSVAVLASVLGLLAFSLLVQLKDGNERYGTYFLQAILSIFAFSMVTSDCWRGGNRSRLITEWIRLAKTCLIIVTAAGILLGCTFAVTHRHTGIQNFWAKVVISFLLLLILAGISALMKRSHPFSAVASAVLMSGLMIGFLAWMPDWIRHGLGEVKTDITYASDEVHGLRRLGELMAPNERFATNRHAFDSPQPPIARSYGYSALSERSVLLEGYLDRGETALPWFNDLLRDNDLLFTTTSPETVRNIARAWQVRWLVARPGTDISLPRPLPPWLVEQQDSGDLKIYRVD
jgi:hypothetical protein